jgi:hypothetical protein
MVGVGCGERGGDSGQLVGLHVNALPKFQLRRSWRVEALGGAGNGATKDDRPMQGTVDYPSRFVPA